MIVTVPVPVEIFDVGTYLGAQTPLVRGDISDSVEYEFAWGEKGRGGPGMYLHVDGAALKMSVADFVEQGYRALGRVEDDWATFERDSTDGDGSTLYVSDVYEALHDDWANVIKLRRRDGSENVNYSHVGRTVTELVPDVGNWVVLGGTTDGWIVVNYVPGA